MNTKIYLKHLADGEEWFELKQYTEIDEWSSHCIKVKGKALTNEVIEKIKVLLKTK